MWRMENITITKSLKKQLDQVIVHEQVENDIAINKNLSANQINQQFITPKKINYSIDIYGHKRDLYAT
jgi:hypothetical protein